MGNLGAKAKRDRLMKLVSSDENMEELQEFLAQPGVNVNIRDRTRYKNTTALMYSAERDSVQCVKILLDAGADVNAEDKYGQTALTYAVRPYSHDCVNTLLAAGADVNKKNKIGCTALWYAVHAGRKVYIDVLLDAGADVTTAGPGIPMLLIPALRIGHDKIVALLIEAGVDVNDFALGKSSASRVNPLTCLAKVAAFSADNNKYMRSVKCAQLLLKAGVHVNKKFMDRSALTWYCYQNRHPDEIFIKLLYAAGQVVEWQELVDCAGRHVFIPEWLQGVEAVRKREEFGDLKDLCRVSIRTHLLNQDLHSNLFIRVPRLRLPSPLTRHLLFDMALDTMAEEDNNSVSKQPMMLYPVLESAHYLLYNMTL